MVKMNANDIVNSYNKATSSTKVSTGNKKVDSIVSAYNVAKTQPAPKITTAKVSKPVAPKKLVATPTPPLTGIKKVQQTGTDIFTSAQNTAKKIGKDLQVTFVKATQPPQNIKDIQKLEKKPLIINPNQKKLNSTQLQQLNGTEANSAQLTAKAKQTNVGKVVSGKISKANEDLGPVLARAYVPQQYLDPKNPFSGRFNPAIKPTAGKIIGGAIDDFIIATMPITGAPIKTGRDVLKEGPNVLSAIKSGTLFSAAGALVSKLKEEEVTFKQSLINFGLGALIGMGEPTIQVGAKNIDIIGAKKTLSDYGIKASDFKNPEALKNKFRDTVKKLHPDKGGNQDEFIQFTDAFNKVTSAGVDSSWKLPDIGLWVKSLWKKKPSEAEIIKTAENVKTKLEKLQDKNKSPIEPGTYTPEQVTGMVISSGQSKTPEGMELLKSAIEARQAGQNIMIEKPSADIESSVLQTVDTKTGTTEFKTIPKGQLEQYKTSVDGTKSGIAGKEIDGKITHLTAKTPEQMVKAGAVETGSVAPQPTSTSPQPNREQIAVPKSQLPVGEGKLKASKLEARMKGVMKNVKQEQIDELGLSTYNQMNQNEQIAKAAEYVTNNPQEAMDVIRGKIEAPKGLIPESIFIALTENSAGDLTLGTKLASLEATALGQRIGILRKLNKNSPIKILNEVYNIRAEEFKKTHGNKSAKEVVKAYTKKAKFEPPKLSDWGSLIKEVRC